MHQYYEIEQTTDLWSFNTGRVQAKLGVNEKEAPEKSPVSFALLDNRHLTLIVTPPPQLLFAVYFRALVNFTHSIDYSPQLEDAGSEEFREVSEAVVDTVR